jgi:hypothetical protein
LKATRVKLSARVRHFAFDQGIILWSERGSRVYVYNHSVLLLWPSLVHGTTLNQLAAILADFYDVERQRALADCGLLLDHLRCEGLLRGSRDNTVAKAAETQEPVQHKPELSEFRTAINGKNIRICTNPAIAELLCPLFPKLLFCNDTADIEIRCESNEQSGCVTVNGKLRVQTEDPAEIVGAILEQVICAINPQREWLAFLHAGSVRRHGAAIVLPGLSGSGKSTLIGFLATAGFDYHCDDIVPLVAPRGEAVAFPLAINLKAGSRGLYPAPAGFELVASPGRSRTDQLLLPPTRLWQTPPAPSRAVVFPKYGPHRSTGLASLAPIDGLARLFNDRIFLGHPLEERRIANFLRWAQQTPFYSLEYSDLAEAAQCLLTLTG